MSRNSNNNEVVCALAELEGVSTRRPGHGQEVFPKSLVLGGSFLHCLTNSPIRNSKIEKITVTNPAFSRYCWVTFRRGRNSKKDNNNRGKNVVKENEKEREESRKRTNMKIQPSYKNFRNQFITVYTINDNSILWSQSTVSWKKYTWIFTSIN